MKYIHIVNLFMVQIGAAVKDPCSENYTGSKLRKKRKEKIILSNTDSKYRVSQVKWQMSIIIIRYNQ